MVFTGPAIKYGDDISTDLIFPGRYTYQLLTEEEMALHALEDLDPTFSQKDVAGSIIVAGENWGCGSAREQAVKSIKQKGISAVIAKSIARIYYRNCINEGVIPIVCPEAAQAIDNGELVTIDIINGIITTPKRSFRFPKFPEFVLGILSSGGLIAQVKKEIGQK